MKPGPKPQPTALKILAGTRPCRMPKAEPQATKGIPDPPCALSPTAAREWARLAPLLDRMGVLTEADGAALALYAETFAMWAETGKKLREGGYLTVTPEGGIKVNPLAALHHKARADMLKTLAEFGLTPSSRSRVNAVPAEEADPLAEFLKARKQP